MKYKIIYNGLLYIEVEANNEEERKEGVKGILYSIDSISRKLDENGHYIEKDKDEDKTPVVEYASEGQIRYMEKLGINFPDNCTKIQAIDLINEYKIAHNIPIRGKGQ